MNNKPNVPEELITFSFSLKRFWTNMKVNGWFWAAMLTAAVSYSLLHGNIFKGWHIQENNWPLLSGLHQHHGEDWPVVIRVIIELLPMFMSLLWARDVARWIRGMDELHRRIMLETCLFAASGTFFFITAWNRLQNTGVLKAIFQPPTVSLDAVSWVERWDWHRLAYLDFSYFPLTGGLLLFFFGLGYFIFNRRYK
jgi:hypothetical protein